MSFDKLTDFAISVVLAAALAGQIDCRSWWRYFSCN